MAGLSNHIELFLKSMLEESDGVVEIGRNELAQQFHCAPSQINYVLTTRFTPYKGYHIESRRGGSGYIRIIKLSLSEEASIESMIKETLGSSITKDRAIHLVETLLSEEILEEREANLMVHALEDTALKAVPGRVRNAVRADLLRNMLLVYLKS